MPACSTNRKLYQQFVPESYRHIPKEATPIAMSIIQQVQYVGREVGESFNFNKTDENLVVNRVEAWTGVCTLRGIRITFSDGSQQVAGVKQGRYQGSIQLDYDAGERITYLSLYGNVQGTRLVGMYMKTSTGEEWFPKSMYWQCWTEHRMEIGSGIIIGATGKHGREVEKLAVLMLRNVTSSEMIDVEYHRSDTMLPPPQRVLVHDITLSNPSDTDSVSGFQKITRRRQSSGEWNVTSGVSFNKSFNVTSQIPEVAEVGAQSQWQFSNTFTYDRSWSLSGTSEISFALIVPKRQKTRITVSYNEGVVQGLPFSAKMKLSLENDSTFITMVQGVYNGLSTSRIEQNSETVALWNHEKTEWEASAC